jgi:hypothetical protein
MQTTLVFGLRVHRRKHVYRACVGRNVASEYEQIRRRWHRRVVTREAAVEQFRMKV